MMPPVNRIAVLLSILSPEMSQMELEVQTLAQRCEELETRNDFLSDDLDEERRTNSDLRSRLSTAEEKVRQAGNNEWLKQDLENLRQRNLDLTKALDAYKSDPKVMEPRLLAYIMGEGRNLALNGKKIECIKGVREITPWGLKEAKDFVEGFRWDLLPLEGSDTEKVGAMIKIAAPKSAQATNAA